MLKEPSFACSIIDEYVEKLESIIDDLNNIDSPFIINVEIQDCADQLVAIKDGFEFCRQKITDVRTWGLYWKEKK